MKHLNQLALAAHGRYHLLDLNEKSVSTFPGFVLVARLRVLDMSEFVRLMFPLPAGLGLECKYFWYSFCCCFLSGSIPTQYNRNVGTSLEFLSKVHVRIVLALLQFAGQHHNDRSIGRPERTIDSINPVNDQTKRANWRIWSPVKIRHTVLAFLDVII